METVKAKELLEKYQLGLCTEEETALVETWYLKHQTSNPVQLSEEERLTDIYKIWDVLTERTTTKLPLKRAKLWYPMAAAASILLILGADLYFYRQLGNVVPATNEISPGKNAAILTLANGKKINLNDAIKGKLAEETGVRISKTADGRIVYDASQVRNESVGYNTISTPRGGQYQVNLPDGSQVWLNAASCLKFPTRFANLKERKVVLNGEAYFKVKHNAKQPFRVQTAGQLVEDIGTEFNINSYANEPVVKTTLIEGIASVSSLRDSQAKILNPGQQAILNKSGVINVQPADLQEVIAWKNGDFVFRNTDFRTVMRKIARWYDVEVIYDSSAPSDIPLGGLVSRSKNISVLLNLMEETGAVHFKVEGRKITVSK